MMRDTPRGAKALLFEEAALKEKIERIALDLFATWGYSRVVAPALEYWQTLTKGLDREGEKRVITLTDPSGGARPLALRSDVTPQIARIAATTLKERPSPLRLSYAETVYRSAAPGLGRRTEVYQAGAEFIGSDSPEADAELIRMGIEALLALGIDGADISVTLSHPGYVKAALDEVNLDETSAVAVQNALMKKATGEVTKALDKAGATGPARELLDKATKLLGDATILETAPNTGAATSAALDNLRATIEIIQKNGFGAMVTVDLGEIRRFGYYTGLTFEGFVTGMPKRAFAGGRYDDLLGLYGKPRPATGFALDLDHLLDYLMTHEPQGIATNGGES